MVTIPGRKTRLNVLYAISLFFLLVCNQSASGGTVPVDLMVANGEACAEDP